MTDLQQCWVAGCPAMDGCDLLALIATAAHLPAWHAFILVQGSLPQVVAADCCETLDDLDAPSCASLSILLSYWTRSQRQLPT
jgi:hypothetical protein